MGRISAVLIVSNEEKNLESCLKALEWTDEIVVVDGHSTDRTEAIARQFTSKVYKREFDNFSEQKNYAIAQSSGEWILSVDADEIVSPELERSIRDVVSNDSDQDGFYVTRNNINFGKSLRFGGQGSEKILRLFKRNKGRFVQPIHETIKVRGPVGNLTGDLKHESAQSVSDYLNKLELYTDFEADWMFRKRIRPTIMDLSLKPLFRFIYYYFLRFGFLDGYEGFLFHCFSSFYYFVKFAKLRERYQKKES